MNPSFSIKFPDAYHSFPTIFLLNLFGGFQYKTIRLYKSIRHTVTWNWDTGVSIGPENIERLFSIEKQFRTKGTEGEYGSGIGLMLCKEFIVKNEGKIWAESEIGKGTKVKFTLPV